MKPVDNFKRLMLLTSAAVLFLLGGCKSMVVDELDDMQKQLDSFEAKIELMNTSLTSLQSIVNEIADGGYVSSVSESSQSGVNTYTLTFSDGRTITIHDGKDGANGKDGVDGKDGKDGTSPEIGISQDSDGEWYWTLNGSWLLNNGSKVKATGKDGKAPELKIEDGYWYVSSDDGSSWERLGKATGEDGVGAITSVNTEFSDYVILTLADGTTINVPRFRPISITFTTEDLTSIGPTETIPIGFTLEGDNLEDVTVTAASDGNYTVSVSRASSSAGTVSVKCPNVYTDGFINIIVSDGSNHTFVKVISFYKRTMAINDGLVYNVPTEGGTVRIPFTSNFEWNLNFENGCDSWISLIRTKADESGTIELSVAKNDDESIRTGLITIRPENNPDHVYETIQIIQASAYFTLSQSMITAKSDGEEFTVTMTSSRGVSPRLPDGCDWITYELTQNSGIYTMKINVARNSGTDVRNAVLDIYTEDGATLQGSIIVKQFSKSTDHQADMILYVSANEVNHHTVYLPVHGDCECYIDWGDGNGTVVDRNVPDEEYISHTYDVSGAGYYDVIISGTVQSLSFPGENIPSEYMNGIREVKQWGDLSIQSMSNAFYRCSALTSVPDDTIGAFDEVEDWSCAFRNCISLESVPEELFAFADKALNMYQLFLDCRMLKTIPEGLFSKCSSVTSFSTIFAGCTSLTTVPENLFSNCPEVLDFSNAFSSSSIENIPSKLFYNCPKVTSFGGAFNNCGHLKKVPVDLFDNNRKVSDFGSLFYYSFYETTDESPYTVINGVKYHLYERYKAPDYFVVPSSTGACFTSDTFADSEAMPIWWKDW